MLKSHWIVTFPEVAEEEGHVCGPPSGLALPRTLYKFRPLFSPVEFSVWKTFRTVAS